MAHFRPSMLVGELLSAAIAPLFAGVAALRGGRSLHPRGVVYSARVVAAPDTPLPELSAALAGRALVRLSGAWWRSREWPDVLGVAIRFTGEKAAGDPPDDRTQDLLLASVRRPWTLFGAPFTTNTHDFLANDYYGVAPFLAAGRGRFELRLRPMRDAPAAPAANETRETRLAASVASGDGVFVLEARPSSAVRRAVASRGRGWGELAALRLVNPERDRPEPRFDPFRTGCGLEPVGFVHGLRRDTYPESRGRRRARRSG